MRDGVVLRAQLRAEERRRQRQSEKLEAEIGRLADFLSDPEMFTKEPVKFRKAGEALSERQAQLAAAEAEWLDLAERA